MMERATIQGEGLQMLLRRINVAQLVYGRCGLLVDAPQGVDVDKATPYISFYLPERIINWDAGKLKEGMNELDLVVLDESGYRREGFTWKTEKKYRVLTKRRHRRRAGWVRASAGRRTIRRRCQDQRYSMPDRGFHLSRASAAIHSTNIPFVFIGANDLVPEPEIPPLLGLSNLSSRFIAAKPTTGRRSICRARTRSSSSAARLTKPRRKHSASATRASSTSRSAAMPSTSACRPPVSAKCVSRSPADKLAAARGRRVSWMSATRKLAKRRSSPHSRGRAHDYDLFRREMRGRRLRAGAQVRG
jgi:hypothetical protein